MQFSSVAALAQRKRADILVVPFWQGKQRAEAAVDVGKLKKVVAMPVSNGDFKGEEGEQTLLYVDGERVMLLGLGEKKKVSVEKLRRAYSALTKACHKKKWTTLNILLPTTSLDKGDMARGVAEGLLLTNYVFEKLKRDSVKKGATVLIKKAALIGASAKEVAVAKRCGAIADGVCLARDLVNGNADDVTPQYLAQVARGLGRKSAAVKTTVFDKKRIEKEKMGLLLAVNQGSQPRCDPAFIIVRYTGNPKAKEHTVIVGKGITYDTGGLSLKTSEGMVTMKTDMSGAAAVLGTMAVVSALKMKVNVTGVIAATENSISALAYKPGDVYTAYSGKTVEIGNTDAEGRLVLADALAYTVKKLKPSRIVDMATLTGSIVIALGDHASGMMSNDDALAKALAKAGDATYERVWRMPLHEEYKKQLKSDIADISNVGGRSAGSITAACFLQEFIGDTPWAHLDIAATARMAKPTHYLPGGGTGVGVRLMVQMLENA